MQKIFRGVLAGALLATLWPGLLHAQKEEEKQEGNAPQILTSDLFRRQFVRTEKIQASFIFLDSDKIVEIKINGEVQPIEPDNAVVLAKEFLVDNIEILIEVSATDEAGNTREKSYLVIREEPPIPSRPVSPDDLLPPLDKLFSIGPAVTTPPAVQGRPPPPPPYHTFHDALTAPPKRPRSSWPLWTGGGLLAASAVIYVAAASELADALTQADQARTANDLDGYDAAQGQAESAQGKAVAATLLGGAGLGLLYYYIATAPETFASRTPQPALMPAVAMAPGSVSVGVTYRW